MLRKKFIAVATSAALAVSLCPGLAVASTVTAGSVDDNAAAKTVSTQKKVSVKVLKGYDYNSKGLVTSYAGYKLKYSGTNLKYAGIVGKGYSDKFAIKSSNGLVKTATEVAKNGKEKDKTKFAFSYDAAGKVTGYTATTWSNHPYTKLNKKMEKYQNEAESYAYNAAGQLTKAQYKASRTDKSSYTSYETKYAYDNAGNLISVKLGKNPRIRYVNDYRTWVSGESRIQQRIVKYWSNTTKGYVNAYTQPYTYETIKVPKSALKVVKAQQWALINDNVNKAFGPLNNNLYNY